MKNVIKQKKIHKTRVKKYIGLVVGLILLLNIFYIKPVHAVDQVTIMLNGELLVYNDNYGFPFIDENNRTQVPFRLTLEAVGATVTWNQEDFTASAELNGIRVDVPIGERYILKDGKQILIDTRSRIVNDRTFLPIRAVLEAFDAKVSWDQEKFQVVIEYQEEENLFTRIPQYYDLRETNRLSPIRNQFDTGACWAFASYGAMESQLLPDQVWDFSEDHLSLGHGFDLEQADGGNAAISLSYLTRWSGPVVEADDPFNDGINNPDATVVKHVQEVQFIPDHDSTGLKVAVMSYGPVQTSIYIDSSTLDPDGLYYNDKTYGYYYFGSRSYNHDVVIVGWDDHYPKENFKSIPEEDGAYIVRNSYGEDFGDGGYFYISYDDVHIGTNNIVFTRIEDTDNFDNIYQSDWLGYISQIGYNEDTAFFSNVYETKSEKELLAAVSFYATDVDTSYEVYVVQSFTDKADFKNMELIERGSFGFGGYYTVEFENPILVQGRFAVVVRITTPGSDFPVAAEYWKKDKPWLKNVIISDGEGYMSYDGDSWERTEQVLEANTCLKAFTFDYDVALLDGKIPADAP